MPSASRDRDDGPVLALLRLGWRVVLAAHAAVAAAWMWMMPGGFPIGHARWWANRALPLLVMVVCVVGLLGAWRRKDALLWLVALGVTVAWLAAAAAGRIVFPLSGWLVWLPALFLAAALGAATWPLRSGPRGSLLAASGAVLLAVALGVAAPLTQRADDPSTKPLNGPLPQIAAGHEPDLLVSPLHLGEHVTAFTRQARVNVACGNLYLGVSPLLTFWSTSPDRCWTILAPPGANRPRPRGLTAASRDGDTLRLAYGPRGRLAVSLEGEAVQVEASRLLPSSVFSHLNAFCELHTRGIGRLELRFSPCPDVPIEVVWSDYPFGRPARLAYLGADGLFRVVEASSGEKGPFRELAAGPMKRSDPLAVTLYDEGRAACRITLDDWARQASTELSPTAGWGLPQNAIELQLDSPGQASIYITLAGTSVGRGWDSVGHAPGAYRNRMRIEPIPPPQDGGDANAQMPDAGSPCPPPGTGILPVPGAVRGSLRGGWSGGSRTLTYVDLGLIRAGSGSVSNGYMDACASEISDTRGCSPRRFRGSARPRRPGS